MRIGVLAFHGSVEEHLKMLSWLQVKSATVRTVADLERVDALIIPGGESTTICKLMRREQLDAAIRKRASDGMPVMGTCAGLIVCSRKVLLNDSTEDIMQRPLGLIDLTVARNDYGRQVESFTSTVEWKNGRLEKRLPAVFIRAPVIKHAGADVSILAMHDNVPVVCRQKNILAATFHPELTSDKTLHQYFVGIVKESKHR